jgi:hypothetical protein
MIQFALYTQPGGPLLADYSGRVEKPVIARNEHGAAEASGFVPMSIQEAFQLYDMAGLLHVVFSDQASDVIYEGRLEDVQIQGDGVSLRAFGYSRSLSDNPYTALWSMTDVAKFRPILASELAGALPDRYSFDTNNRIYITAQKNATLGNTGTNKFGMICFQLPDQSTRDIIGASFDYIQVAPNANWRFFFQTRNADFSGIANPWGVTGGIGITPGNVFVTFAAAKVVNFFMDFNAADAAFANETGSAYLIITNLRLVTSTANKVDTTTTANIAAGTNVSIPVVTTARMYVGQRVHLGIPAALGEAVTVKTIADATHFTADPTAAMASGGNVQAHVIYADEIVKDMVSAVSTLNSLQLSSSTTLIQSPALDLLNESYEDQYPADILNRLVHLGDNQTTPRQWEWGVALNRLLYFRPQASAARTWYVDVSDIDVQRTIDSLYNSMYATYQEAAGRTLRSAVSADSASVARYGLTRRKVFGVQTTSLTQAQVQRDAELADTKDPRPRSGITIRQVTAAAGGDWPLTQVRAGDTMVIRNLPPTLSTAIDRIRTFRITRVELDLETNTLTIEPEHPLPTLAALLAQATPPSWVTTPWWLQAQ